MPKFNVGISEVHTASIVIEANSAQDAKTKAEHLLELQSEGMDVIILPVSRPLEVEDFQGFPKFTN